MSKTVADQLAHTLTTAGGKRIHGITGKASINGRADEILDLAKRNLCR